MARVLVVVDNRPGSPGLAFEHGLALWLEHGGRTILYDTGAGGALMLNLAALGLDPVQPEAVILSHGHYDHIGGLAALARARRDQGLATPVWCHRAAFAPHLKGQMDPVNIGTGRDAQARYEELGAEFHWVQGAASPWPGVTLLAPIPRRTAFEGPAPGLTTLVDGHIVPDPLLDDLALVLTDLPGGPAVLTGCAHAGVINVLLAATEAAGQPPRLVVGGTHLGPAPPAQRQAALAELQARPELTVAAGHCTGEEVLGIMARELGPRFVPLAVGREIAL